MEPSPGDRTGFLVAEKAREESEVVGEAGAPRADGRSCCEGRHLPPRWGAGLQVVALEGGCVSTELVLRRTRVGRAPPAPAWLPPFPRGLHYQGRWTQFCKFVDLIWRVWNMNQPLLHLIDGIDLTHLEEDKNLFKV